MIKIINIVLNSFDNDARVKKTISLFEEKDFEYSIIALNNNTNKLFIKENYHNKYLFRIKGKNLSNIHSLFKRFIERQFLYRIYLFKSLKIILKKFKYNIVYSNDFDTLMISFLFLNKYKFKLIYDSHELWTERHGAKQTLLHKFFNICEYHIEKYITKKCNAVITVSNGIAEELSKRYNIKKPYVIRNLDTIKPLINEKEKKQLRERYNIPQNAILIVYQGGLTYIRGIDELIEAMDKLNNNIHLLLMGNGLSKENKEKIRDNNRIHYIGMISQEELHKYTCMGDIGIHPMRIDNILNHKLALPNKFSQYMNAGLCLALYRTQETERLIKESKAGILFESGNSDNIVRAINSIITSRRLEEYKKNAREYFLNYFNWDIEKNKLISIINNVIKEKM